MTRVKPTNNHTVVQKNFTLTSRMLTESTGTKGNFQVSQMRKLKRAQITLDDFWMIFGASCLAFVMFSAALAMVFVVLG